MISFHDVISHFREHIHQHTTTLPIQQAAGCVLAQDLHSAIALPPFAQSAMDGFAIIAKHTQHASPDAPLRLTITGTIFAGMDNTSHLITPGEAYHITTGSMLPQGADAVVRIEDVRVDGDAIILTSPVALGRDVRPVGEWFAKEHLIASAHQQLTPATAAMAAMAGIDRVDVYARPKIGLITCGDEIIEPGIERHPWQIYNGNITLLQHMLTARGLDEIEHIHLPDEMDVASPAVRALARRVDLLLTTGGASIGARDILRHLSRETTPYFEKVAQRPGKPTFLTQLEGTIWLGLPGPPLAAYTNAITHLFDLLDCIEGNTTQSWRALTPDPKWENTHPSFSRVMLAIYDHDTAQVRPASKNPYDAMLVANAVVVSPPSGHDDAPVWRFI